MFLGEDFVGHLKKAAAAEGRRRRLFEVLDDVLTRARSHRVQI